MTEEEKREQTAMNMAMMLAYKVGFRGGMDFQEEHGEEAKKMFTGGISSEGDSGASFVYPGVFSNNDYRNIPRRSNG